MVRFFNILLLISYSSPFFSGPLSFSHVITVRCPQRHLAVANAGLMGYHVASEQIQACSSAFLVQSDRRYSLQCCLAAGTSLQNLTFPIVDHVLNCRFVPAKPTSHPSYFIGYHSWVLLLHMATSLLSFSSSVGKRYVPYCTGSYTLTEVLVWRRVHVYTFWAPSNCRARCQR